MQENTPGFLPPGARSFGTASVLLRRKLSLHHRSPSRRGKLAQQEGRPSFPRPLRLTVCSAKLSARQGSSLRAFGRTVPIAALTAAGDLALWKRGCAQGGEPLREGNQHRICAAAWTKLFAASTLRSWVGGLQPVPSMRPGELLNVLPEESREVRERVADPGRHCLHGTIGFPELRVWVGPVPASRPLMPRIYTICSQVQQLQIGAILGYREVSQSWTPLRTMCYRPGPRFERWALGHHAAASSAGRDHRR